MLTNEIHISYVNIQHQNMALGTAGIFYSNVYNSYTRVYIKQTSILYNQQLNPCGPQNITFLKCVIF